MPSGKHFVQSHVPGAADSVGSAQWPRASTDHHVDRSRPPSRGHRGRHRPARVAGARPATWSSPTWSSSRATRRDDLAALHELPRRSVAADRHVGRTRRRRESRSPTSGVTDGAADALMHAAAQLGVPVTAAATGGASSSGRPSTDADGRRHRAPRRRQPDHRALDVRADRARRSTRRHAHDGTAEVVPIRGLARRGSLAHRASTGRWPSTPRSCSPSRRHFVADGPRPDRRRAGDARPDVERALRPQDVPRRRSSPTTGDERPPLLDRAARVHRRDRRAVRAVGVRRQRRHRRRSPATHDRAQGRDPQPPVGRRAVRRRQHRRRRRDPRRARRRPPPDRRHRRPVLRAARHRRSPTCPTARCTRCGSARA